MNIQRTEGLFFHIYSEQISDSLRGALSSWDEIGFQKSDFQLEVLIKQIFSYCQEFADNLISDVLKIYFIFGTNHISVAFVICSINFIMNSRRLVRSSSLIWGFPP